MAYISSFTTLLPGDVILTGTPEGVALMQPGQEVSVEIEGIGTLTNASLGRRDGPSERATARTTAVLGDLAPEQVRVRFPPSPTGNLHVGNVRSALFNWVFARHYGGTFVLRVEDTDAGRNLEESYQVLYDSLTWLGLTWDEGPGVGGPYAPYIQTERGEIYRDVVTRLLGAELAYRCYCSREEIEAREAARPPGAPSGYDGFCRDLSAGADRGAGGDVAPSVVRMRVPDADIAFDDLVRGPVRFAAAHVPDYVIVRGNGEPLYTLVNPVDDSLMEITHVLRGEDLLPSTPRQIVLYRRPGADRCGQRADADRSVTCRPCWARGTGDCPSGTRDRDWPSTSSRATCPRRCSTTSPCLAGRSPRTATSLPSAEMVEAFDIRRVNANPARFDARSARRSTPRTSGCCRPSELAEHLVPFLARAGLISDPPLPAERDRLQAATPLIQERINTLSEAVDLLAFLFTEDERLEIDPAVALNGDSADALDAASAALDRRGGVRPRGHRGGVAYGAGRGARPQAAAGVRSGAGRDHRPADLTAAVRVDRAARPRRSDSGPDSAAGPRRVLDA